MNKKNGVVMRQPHHIGSNVFFAFYYRAKYIERPKL